jgi:hypothetical protein
MNIPNIIKTLTWAWAIIVGGLMITPEGIVCIACGPVITKILGVISILLGISAFIVDRQMPADR